MAIASSPAIRAVCVEDHAFVSDWIAEQLEDGGDELVASVASTDQLAQFVETGGANVFIMDVKLPGAQDPFIATEELRRLYPHVRVMFLSASISSPHVEAAMESGALGYFSKGDPPEDIAVGIRTIGAGRYAFGPSVLDAFPALREHHGKPKASSNGRASLHIPSPVEALTPREKEVLRLIGSGLHRAAIAKTLHRSPKTVDKHRAAVMKKLNIHDRAELVLFAVRSGLVTVEG